MERKLPSSLVETYEEMVKRGVRELTHADLKPELVDPPEVFHKTFYQADHTSRNAYNIARFAAREQLILFERRLFEWLDKHWCQGCPYRDSEAEDVVEEPLEEKQEPLRFPEVVRY